MVYSFTQALDLLIWYLRVVHSVDYYNAMVFPTEDCMPHRCGIFTVRPHKPTALTQDDGMCMIYVCRVIGLVYWILVFLHMYLMHHHYVNSELLH